MKCALLLISTCLATACAPLTTNHPSTEVVIDVRDAQSHAPIEGATVLGAVGAFYYPVMEENTFGRGGVIPSFVAINEPRGWTAMTDADGRARTSASGGSPSTIAILAPGYPMARGRFTTGEDGEVFGVAFWTRGVIDKSISSPATVEFRVLASP